MRVLLITSCLLATLAVSNRALADPPSTSPTSPSQAPTAAPIASDLQQIDAEARQIDATSRLSPEQLFQLLQQREARRADSNFDPASIVIPIFFFSSALTGFLGWLLASYRRARMLHETVRQMVEKGAEIPTALLAPPPRKQPSDLRRGIILSTAGGGLAIFLAALPDVPEGVWVSGITLALIGVGHLIVWRVQTGKGRLSSELTPEPQN